MNTLQLNEYSQRFADALLAAYPEWRVLAMVDTAEGADRGSLLVKVEPPLPRDINWPLHISTDGREITVGFDAHHVHFTNYSDGDDAKIFASALAYIREILSDEVGAISWWYNEQFRGSCSYLPGSEVSVPAWASGANRMRIRSWSGVFDRDIEI